MHFDKPVWSAVPSFDKLRTNGMEELRTNRVEGLRTNRVEGLVKLLAIRLSCQKMAAKSLVIRPNGD
jgi:pyruvate dehydrogenase complex dehydrogenase (E1) component